MDLATKAGVIRLEVENKSRQWHAYDKIARMQHARDKDIHRLRYSKEPAAQHRMRMLFREEWRIEQEVQALSLIARLDSDMLSSGKKSIGACPGGQLSEQAAAAPEMASLEVEELAVVHGLVPEELSGNGYLPRAPGEPASWAGPPAAKADAARAAREKLRAEAKRVAPALDDALATRARCMAQLLHLCEIRLRGAGGRLAAPQVDEFDPFLHCCRALQEQRDGWLAVFDQAAARAGDEGTRSDATKGVRRSQVTLQKIHAFRQAHNRRRLSRGDDGSSARIVTPPPPHVPAPMRAVNPRAASPALPPPPAAAPAATGRCAPSAAAATFRLQRWIRAKAYWCRVRREWTRACRERGAAEDARYRQELRETAARANLKASHAPAAVCIQRVARGWLYGRRLAKDRRAAVATAQRFMRGALARRRKVPAAKMLQIVRQRRACGRLLDGLLEEDRAEAEEADEYFATVLNLTAEVSRAQRAISTEEAVFRKEWKAWEQSLLQTCVEHVSLDPDWAEQTPAEGAKQYFNLKTKRVSTEHPNLRLANIHRKRQWVKVSRVRDEKKSAMQAYLTKAQDALHRQREQLATALLLRRQHNTRTLVLRS